MARARDGFRIDKKAVDDNKAGMLAKKSGRKNRADGTQERGSND